MPFIRGRTEKNNTNEELTNLRVIDAEEAQKTKSLRVWNNDGDYRYISLDEKTLYLLKKTIEAKEYIINNGKNYNRKRPDKELKMGIGEKAFPFSDTGYVFRVSGGAKQGKVKPTFFNARINTIKDWVGNPYLTPTNLYFSGMIEYAKQLKEEKGSELDKMDYIKISRKFEYGKPRILDNGEEDWSVVIAKIKSKVEDYFKLKGHE